MKVINNLIAINKDRKAGDFALYSDGKESKINIVSCDESHLMLYYKMSHEDILIKSLVKDQPEQKEIIVSREQLETILELL